MEDMNYVGPDGCHYVSAKQYAWITAFGFCGCYDDGLFDLTFEILEKLHKASLPGGEHYYYEYEGVTDERKWVQELILHVFDDKELTEHGGSVRGSWLSEKGRELCALVFAEPPAQKTPQAKEEER